MTATSPRTKAPSHTSLRALSAPLPTQQPPPSRPAPAAARATARTASPTRLLIADDHPFVRKGIGACLSRQPHLEVVSEAADGREALAKARELLPDVVLLDIDMPHMSGLAVAEALRDELPNIKVLIVSTHQETAYVMRVLNSGALGYILKDSPVEELVAAIDKVISGEPYFSPPITRIAINRFVQGNGNGPQVTDLTAREREVLTHIAEGYSNKEIADQLGIGLRTAETHREHLMKKLNIRSIAGLTRFAIAEGMVTLREDIRR